MNADQIDWFKKNHLRIEVDRKNYDTLIASKLTEVYDLMSELESILNTGMQHAGYDRYALSRDEIHTQRELIHSMASQRGARHRNYPLNLPGGEYRGD